MTIRNRVVIWHSGLLLLGLLLVACSGYYEVVVEHPNVSRTLIEEGEDPAEELGEVLLYGGLPAMLVALVGGWFLMRHALAPLSRFTKAVEKVYPETLGERLPRTGSGDEIDRLTEVFNSMMGRLDNSFSHIREFTLNASHELKTPLTIMHGEIETRLRDCTISPAEHEFFADQLDEILRLTKIVDALAFLSKADTGCLSMANEAVRLDELVRDSFADAQLLGRPHQLQVELKTCDATQVCGDRYRLKQLLLNLTENAIKYTEPEGRLTLALNRKNGTAELSITNTGPGIPKEKLPRVFDRFYRGDPAHQSTIEGSGLGLSIAQSIVKAHQGTIQIVSEPDRLTTVTVRLPVQATFPHPA